MIFYLIGIEFDSPSDEIIEYKKFGFGYLETDSISLSVFDAILSFLERKMPAMSIISRRELELFLFLAQLIKPLGSTKTIVRASLLTELMKPWLIEFQSLTLHIRPVWSTMADTLIRSEPEEIVCIEYRVDGTFDKPGSISIFNTDDIFSLIVVRPEVAI